MALPSVLFSTSTTNHKPEAVIKQILKVPELPEPQILNDAILGYQWSFETKYYTTTIHLCTTAERTIGNQEFADSLEAFIHFFDPNEPESFELTKAWLPYLEHIEPTIQILVCNTSKHTDEISRKTALEWCIDNSFELVELNPEQDDDSDDEEDDFQETTGLARIVQALHAHTWSNLEMKENPTIQSPYVRQLMMEQHLLNKQEASSNDTKTEDSTHVPCQPPTKDGDSDKSSEKCHSKNTGAEANNESSPISGKEETADPNDVFRMDNVDWSSFLGPDDKQGQEDEEWKAEEFEELFKKFKSMKEKAETLPPEERKKYAEKVAISFWKAFGGDDDEIEGVDDDSD